MMPDWTRGPAIVIYAVYLVILVSIYIDRRCHECPVRKCAWCGKYLGGRLWTLMDAKVTHGICPTCSARWTKEE